ncbi:flagellar basal body P-ring formation chaperone FlgA [Chromobacterium vaccinii]|uniref:flagellar basal body P-ring formation chaperone FlgA n=1 Tax=Chromobacterium vaccinii TaxID=1108595 RepID=UPI000617E410|nr:flagellar basal body P-ring formation chaperone FlgA [Chromobacterium vaccinii]
MRALPLLLAAWAGAAAAEALVVPASVEVEGRSVSLAQLVSGPAAEEWRVQAAAKVLIGDLRAGERRDIPGARLQAAWKLALGAGAARWTLQAPERVSVTRKAGEPAAERLAKEGETALRARLDSFCSKTALRPEGLPNAAMLPGQGAGIVARLSPQPALARRMVVWLDVFEGRQLYGSWPVWFEVSCERTVVRARRDIAKGEALAAGNVERTIADVVDGRLLSGFEDKIAARALSAGSVLREADAAAAPMVRKGGRVVARLNSGPVRLELEAVTMEDAALGEVVYARRPKEQAVFKTRVAGAGMVDVL